MAEYRKHFHSSSANTDPKHILIFLDGTWNDENGSDGDGVTTNIYRLFRSVAGQSHCGEVPQRIEGDGQVALYFRGVGNDEQNDTLGTYYGGIFGAGEKRIRDHAYAQLVNHYATGDSISIFGFSRGAACARLLAAKIHKHGIPAGLTAVFRDHQNGDVTEEYFLRYEGIEGCAALVEINFLGIFDTVGAFGVPIDFALFPLQKINLFRDLTVAPSVQRVVHCVSIDESREPFVPTLCNCDDRVEEVWFAGAHADIGGGYRLNELGRVPLKFMVERLNRHFAGRPVRFDAEILASHTQVDLIRDRVHLHYHGAGMQKSPREIYAIQQGKKSALRPKIHRSVIDLHEAQRLHLVETEESFIKLIPILYTPQNLKHLDGAYDIVE